MALRPESSFRHRLTVGHVAVALLLVQMVLRGWTSVRGFYYLDDFVALSHAMERPPLADLTPSSAAPRLQVMPPLLTWAVAHGFGLTWRPIAIALLLLQSLVSWMFFRLLVSVAGARPLVLIPFALAIFAPLGMPGTIWWSSALTELPLQLCLVAALWSSLHHLRTRQMWAAAASAAAVVGGLLFTPKALLVEILLFGTLIAWFGRGSGFGRVLGSVRLSWPVWLAHALALVFAASIGLLTWDFSAWQEAHPRAVLELGLTTVRDGTIPGLLGGPFTFTPFGEAGALANPSSFVVALSILVVTATIGMTTWYRARAGRAWILLGLYVIGVIAFMVSAGGAAMGGIAGLDLRPQASMPFAAAWALTWALIPVIGPWPDDAEPPATRPEPQTVLEAKVLSPLRAVGALGQSSPQLIATIVTILALGLGSAWSQAAFDPWWTNNPARQWVGTAVTQIQSLPAEARIAPTIVPKEVLWGLAHPYNESTRLLSPILGPDQGFDVGTTTSSLYAFDREGLLREAGVLGPSATSGPDACGWVIGAGDRRIPFTARSVDAQPVLRLGYVSDTETTLPVTIGTERFELPIRADWGLVFLRLPAATTTVTFHATPLPATICTNDLIIGGVVPIPGTTT